MQELTDLYQSLVTRNWFAVAAFTIMLGIQIGKTTVGSELYAKIPNGYRFLVPVLLASGTAFVHGFAAHESLGASVFDAMKIALGAMGGAAALKESPLPWGGGPGGTPAPKKGQATAPARRASPPFPGLRDADLDDDDKTPVDRKPPPPSDPPSAA